MKKLLALFTLFTLAIGISYGQMVLPNQVPTAVKKTFEKSYPAAKDITWEKALPYYIATFKKDNVGVIAAFDKSGKWIETTSAFDVRKLPKNIKDKLKSLYQDAAVQDAVILETAGAKFYKVKMKRRDRVMDVLLTPEGEVAAYNSPVKYKGK